MVKRPATTGLLHGGGMEALFRNIRQKLSRGTRNNPSTKEEELLEQKKRLEEKESEFRDLFENLSSGVVILEPLPDRSDFIIKRVNHAAESMEGLRREQVIGKPLLEVFPIAEELGFISALQRVENTGHPEYYPYTIERDGQLREYRTNYIYMLQNGNLVTIFNDETKNRLLQEELEETKERLELAITGSSDGIWDWHIDSNDLYLSPQWKAQLGYEDHELPNSFETFENQLHPEDKERTFKILNDYLADRLDSFQTEFRMRHKDGTYRWILTRAIAVWDKDGKHRRMAGSHTDITRMKEYQRMLEKARREAIEANRSKSVFLANMSHEIRTPMNAILGFAEILESKFEDPLLNNYLDSIKSSGKTLLQLINDILDLSKIEAGKMDIREKPVDLENVMHEIRDLFRFRAQQKELDLGLEVDPEMPEFLMMDELRIKQILLNLLGNAVKFTNHGFIRIAARSKENPSRKNCINLELEVSDSGIGIKEQHLDTIFKSFHQTDAATINGSGGTGLGLAITSRLTGMMKGEITVSSKTETEDPDHHGTTFTVFLPCIEIASGEKKTSRNPAVREKIRFKKAHLLIVDDVPMNRKMMSSFLGELNLEASECTNGEEALRFCRDTPPDLVIMDLKMPVMDGYQATRRIKEDPGIRNIPVVALTASAIETGDDAGKNLFDGFLIKPVSLTQVIAELQQHLPHERDVAEEETEGKTHFARLTGQLTSLPEADRTHLSITYLPALIRLKETRILGEIRKFGEELLAYGKENERSAIQEWAGLLLDQVAGFDLEQIPGTLSMLENSLKSASKQ